MLSIQLIADHCTVKSFSGGIFFYGVVFISVLELGKCVKSY